MWAVKERSDEIKGTNVHSCVAQKRFELSPESFNSVSAEECGSHKYFQNAN